MEGANVLVPGLELEDIGLEGVCGVAIQVLDLGLYLFLGPA